MYLAICVLSCSPLTRSPTYSLSYNPLSLSLSLSLSLYISLSFTDRVRSREWWIGAAVYMTHWVALVHHLFDGRVSELSFLLWIQRPTDGSIYQTMKFPETVTENDEIPVRSLRANNTWPGNNSIQVLNQVHRLQSAAKSDFYGIHKLHELFRHNTMGRGWRIGWVVAFRPKGHGFDSRCSRHVGTLSKSFTHGCLWRFGVKFRHSIRAVSGARLSSSGLEEAL